LIREPDDMQRFVEPVPAPIAGKDPAGPVSAMGGWRQAHDEQAGLGIAEPRHRLPPVGPVAILPALFFGDPLAVGDQP